MYGNLVHIYVILILHQLDVNLCIHHIYVNLMQILLLAFLALLEH